MRTKESPPIWVTHLDIYDPQVSVEISQVIKESGLSVNQIASACALHRTTVSNKLAGLTQWRTSQIKKLNLYLPADLQVIITDGNVTSRKREESVTRSNITVDENQEHCCSPRVSTSDLEPHMDYDDWLAIWWNQPNMYADEIVKVDRGFISALSPVNETFRSAYFKE